MPVAASISYGDVSLDLPDRRTRKRWDDLDEVTQSFQRASETALTVNGAFPGMSGVVIKELTVTEEVPGAVYLFEARGVGSGPGARLLSFKESPVEEGFDEATARWLTTNRNLVRLAQSMQGLTGLSAASPSMFCVSAEADQHPQSSNHWYVTAQFRGLLNTKEQKVRWSSNGRELRKEQLVNGMPGGWSEPRNSEVLWGRQGLSLSYVTTSVPVWVRVPEQTSGAPHPQAPNVFDPPLSGPASEFTWHWPSGWTRAGVECDILAGTTVCFITENWIYNAPVTFG